MTKEQTTWEDNLRETQWNGGFNIDGDYWITRPTELKNFISKTISQEKEKWVEEIRNSPNLYGQGSDKHMYLDDIINLLQK